MEQIGLLERQQKRALQIIYGFNISYEDILAIRGLERLEERRKSACSNFAQKMLLSERFRTMFPENEYPPEMAQLRNTKKFKEYHSKTDRLYRSPLYSMRRLLNEFIRTTETPFILGKN